MGRVKVRERARTRVLTDEEIRDIDAALDSGAKDIPACFADLIRAKFLTAVRLTEAARLVWPKIEQLDRDDCDLQRCHRGSSTRDMGASKKSQSPVS
jgi:integrase